MATARAKQMTSNFTVPGILTAEMNSEDLVQYFTRLETKLEEIGKLLVNWVTEMDTVSGAMDEFQVCTCNVYYYSETCLHVWWYLKWL